MGWLSDKLFGERKTLDLNHINSLMAPTQNLVTEQLGIGRDLMDPQSDVNQRLRALMAQRASESGAETSRRMGALGAQTGMSAGQTAMQSRMAQHEATSGVNDIWKQGLMSQYSQGLGLMGNMTQMQQGLNENQVNAYMAQLNASNARRSQNQGMGMSALGGILSAVGMSDRRLKTNIELIGKSPKGYNIYEFDYKDKQYGPDRYRGVMSNEVPFAAIKDYNGYEFVNYSHPDLDVSFERIS